MSWLNKDRKMSSCRVIQVSVASILPNPQQPRHTFDTDSLLSLAQSIRRNGILQPLTVREKENGEYELVAGERRLRAAIMAGYTSVPCIAVNLDDTQSAVMSLIENLQREDLNFFDEAAGIAALIEQCGLTQEEVADRLGKAQSTIANNLRLLRLSSSEQETIMRLGLTERHARALLKLNSQQREIALSEIEKHNYNVEETERLVEAIKNPREPVNEGKRLSVIKDIRIFFNTINNAIDLMRRSGINAVAKKQEFDDYYEYTVRIPKTEKQLEKLA